MDTFYIALHRMGLEAKGGIAGMASRLGVRHKTLINKLNPVEEHAEPKIGEFVAMLHDTGDMQPLEVLCTMFGGRFVTRSKRKASSLFAAMIHAITEHSDIAKVYEDAIADGEITAEEKRRLMREISEARDALSVLENNLLDID